MSRLAPRLASALLAVGASGCGSPEAPPTFDCANRGAPTLIVGTGATGFTDAAAGLRAIFGPQGGYHVWVALRGRGLPGRLTVRYGLRRVDDGTAVSPAGLQRTIRVSDITPEWEYPGLFAFLNDGLDPQALVGVRLVIWVEIDDPCGGPPARAQAEGVVTGVGVGR